MTGHVVLEATTQHIERIHEIDKTTRRPWSSEYIDLYRTAPRHRVFLLRSSISEYVFGYSCMRMINADLKIEKLFIRHQFRRLGLGRQLLATILSRLTFFDLTHVCIDVDERDTGEALFYKACGFRGTLMKNRYDGVYDGYAMRRDYPAEVNIEKILKELGAAQVGDRCA